MTGASALFLQEKREGTIGETRFYVVGGATEDHAHGGALDGSRGGQHMGQKRFSRRLVENLRDVGLHPGAFPGG
jgi:hypothetical protein